MSGLLLLVPISLAVHLCKGLLLPALTNMLGVKPVATHSFFVHNDIHELILCSTGAPGFGLQNGECKLW
jgi:hypothetical protein